MQTENNTEITCRIYKLTNTINQKTYIGQTTNTQKRFYIYRTLRCKGQPKLYNALKKYGVNKFTFNVIDTAKTQEHANVLENFYITKYDSINNGYNTKEGGSHGKHSEETKLKISAANKGRVGTMKGKHHTKQTLQLLSKIHTGMHHLNSTKLKIAAANIGRKQTDETKQKISIAHKGKPKTDLHRRKISLIQRQRTTEELNKIQQTRRNNNRVRIEQFMGYILYIMIYTKFRCFIN